MECNNLYDEGKNPGEEANLAKYLFRSIMGSNKMCIQAYGGFGFAKEYDIERKYREARLCQVVQFQLI